MKRCTLSLILVLVMVLTGCGSNSHTITITTGGTGGTYYPVGGAIAQMLTDNIENVTVNAYVGNASVDNCTLIKEGDTDTALVQNNVAYWAYEGLGPFEGNAVKNIRGIASLYPEAIQIVALRSSKIESVEDLDGKKVSVGVEGSGVNFDAKNVLGAYNMTFDDIEALDLSFGEAAKQLKDGTIDAAFVTAGYPTSSIMDVHLNRDIVIVPIDVEKIDAMIERYPYYTAAVIPANTYPGLDGDIRTITTMAIWAVDESLSDDMVYQITKTFWEHNTELTAAHEKGNDITLDSSLQGMSIELHPGAEQYYREVGVK